MVSLEIKLEIDLFSPSGCSEYKSAIFSIRTPRNITAAGILSSLVKTRDLGLYISEIGIPVDPACLPIIDTSLDDSGSFIAFLPSNLNGGFPLKISIV